MSLTKRVTDMEVEFSETRSVLAVRDQELAGIASNYKEKVNDVLARHSEELLAEREKAQQVNYKWQAAVTNVCYLKICLNYACHDFYGFFNHSSWCLFLYLLCLVLSRLFNRP